MTNEKYNQIIHEAYENWIKESWNGRIYPNQNNKEQFINRIKTESEFSEKWGLKIEERELSLYERSVIAGSNHNEVSHNIKMFTGLDEDHTLHKNLDENNIPTKLITITYNNETIEVYE